MPIIAWPTGGLSLFVLPCVPLQLTFTADRLELAGRSLHQDFVRYLGMGRTVMCMFQVGLGLPGTYLL